MPLPKDGEYYVTATLLGSSEIDATGNVRHIDRNRRMIQRWPDGRTIVHMNYFMDEWTKEDAALLKIILDALNEAPKA